MITLLHCLYWQTTHTMPLSILHFNALAMLHYPFFLSYIRRQHVCYGAYVYQFVIERVTRVTTWSYFMFYTSCFYNCLEYHTYAQVYKSLPLENIFRNLKLINLNLPDLIDLSKRHSLILVRFHKNLGVILNFSLKFKKQISKHWLTQKTKLLLCDSLILSFSNYCDIVYH